MALADRFGFNLLASIGCSYLAYQLVEVPSLRRRSRLKRESVSVDLPNQSNQRPNSADTEMNGTVETG